MKLIALAYAWSNKDVQFLLSTVGDTTPCKDPYVSFNPNVAYDGGDTKEHARPDITNFLNRFLPCIDIFNKLRQDTLQLEDHWPTKNAWTKLLNGFCGKSVCNQHRLFKYWYPGVPGKDLPVCDLAASIASSLRIRKRRLLPQALATQQSTLPMKIVSETPKSPAGKDKNKRSKGSAKQRTCHVCRRYKSTYSYSVAACPRCDTCLCLINQRSKGRTVTCQEEHFTSLDPEVRCNGKMKTRMAVDCRVADWK